MGKFLLSFGISVAILFSQLSLNNMQSIAAQEQVEPPYAKWGLLAVKETQAKYTDAQIVDYLHRGREMNENQTIEMFKLWLKKGSREFGVFVNITFDSYTEEILHITFTETDR